LHKQHRIFAFVFGDTGTYRFTKILAKDLEVVTGSFSSRLEMCNGLAMDEIPVPRDVPKLKGETITDALYFAS
jgi:hypothetical protein